MISRIRTVDNMKRKVYVSLSRRSISDFICFVVCCSSVSPWRSVSPARVATTCLRAERLLVVRLRRRHEHFWSGCEPCRIRILLCVLVHRVFARGEVPTQLPLFVGEAGRGQHLPFVLLDVHVVARAFHVLLPRADLALVVVRLVLFMSVNAVTNFTLVAIQMMCAVTVVRAHDGSPAVSKVGARVVSLTSHAGSAFDWWQL